MFRKVQYKSTNIPNKTKDNGQKLNPIKPFYETGFNPKANQCQKEQTKNVNRNEGLLNSGIIISQRQQDLIGRQYKINLKIQHQVRWTIFQIQTFLTKLKVRERIR